MASPMMDEPLALMPRRGRRVSVPRRRADAARRSMALSFSAAAASAATSDATVVASASFIGNPRFASASGALVARSTGAGAPNQVLSDLSAKAAAVKAAVVEATEEPRLTISRLMERRPVAILNHVVGTGVLLFFAGGVAGGLAKTVTAPLDRLKIIMQISGANQQSAAAQAAAKGGLIPAFIAIGKSEGVRGYWKGNVPQVIRILPYSTAMLNSYEFYKKKFADQKTGELSVPARLLSGAAAACTATLVTYPLDIIRFRLSVDPNMKTMGQVIKDILKNEGPRAFFKGLPATCVSISPYSALNFCAFDMFKKMLPEEMHGTAQGIATASLLATALASGSCYPLDTIRRQMQLKSSTYTSVLDAGVSIVARDGVSGLFKGFVPNAVKNMPNKSIQLTTFDVFKKKIAASDKALKEEQEILNKETAAAAKAAGKNKRK